MNTAKKVVAILVVLYISVVFVLYYKVMVKSLTLRLHHTTETPVNATLNVDSPSTSSFVLDTFVGNSNFSIVQNVAIESRTESLNGTVNLCPELPPKLVGKLKVPTDWKLTTWVEIERENPSVEGGSYSPENCTARFRVAIIIPIRDREEQLKALLHHLHPILRRQQIDYTIYTITLAGDGPFNRAKLLNSGFFEANRERQYDCYIFHDVDLLLEDDGCLYWCTDEPREISYHMNKFSYEPLVYKLECRSSEAPSENKYFGGVAMVSHKLFLEVNGFSNLYWGWGGEDDDMYNRIWSKGHDSVNPYGKKCSFSMIKHKREGTNGDNEGRFVLLHHSISRMKHEGLNTLRYKRLAYEKKPLYTNITVDIGEQSEKLLRFSRLNFRFKSCSAIKMPWL